MIQTDTSLTSQLVHELAHEIGDHKPVLADFAARLVPHRNEIIDAWMTMEPGGVASREWHDRAFVVLVEGLQSAGGSVESYLNDVVALCQLGASAGMQYLEALRVLTRLRRASLPFMLQESPPGPEMELLFYALNALERAFRSLVGAVYVEAGQALLENTARMRVTGSLTHGVAHSLNNLLTNILGRAQWLEQKAVDESLRVEARAIQTAALIAADNLQRIQEYASPRQEAESVPMDLTESVNDAVQLTRYWWRDDAEARGIVVDVIRDMVDVPPVMGRRGKLRDAIVELIMNAVEAMPAGGNITLRTERIGDRVQLAVTDMGVGMDEATAARALSPFFTTKGGGHAGLGLMIAESILEAHDSHLEISSMPNRGSTVLFALPIAQVELEQEEQGGEVPAHAVSILIVDDDAAIRDIAARALALHGHRTITAESGTEAVELFREQGPFDVVLSDLGMPGMNGLQVAREVKRTHPRTVFLLMTGWAAELDEASLARQGVDRVIRKPFDVEQVLQVIGQVLARQEERGRG